MNDKRKKFYEEKAKKLGKMVFFEDSSFSLETKGIEFSEKMTLTEDINGDAFTALAVLKNVPISRYTVNANGRIYPRKLWERLFKIKAAEGTLCLADHPEDDGSVKDIWGVWRNMRLGEDIVTADLYLVEEKPIRVLKAGGKIGTSSVGFGELSESDGKTVMADSFDLERASDLVIRPSQGTFASLENIIESIEKCSKDNTNLSESFTNNKDEYKENIIKIDKSEECNKHMDKVYESTVRNNVRMALKSAKASTSFKESIEELTESLKEVPVEMVEQRQKLEVAISEIQEKMEAQIKDAEKSLKEQSLSYADLKSKYDAQNTVISEMTDKLEKASKLIEGSSDSKELKESISKLQEEIKAYKEAGISMKKDIDKYSEKLAVGRKIVAIYKVNESKMIRDIKLFKEKAPSLLKDIKIYDKKMKEAEAHIKTLEKLLKEEFGYEFNGENDTDEIFDDMLDTNLINDDYDMNVIEDSEIEDEANGEFDSYDFYEDEDKEEDDEDEEMKEEDETDEDEEKIEESDDEDEDDKKEDDKEDMKESKAIRSAIKSLYVEHLAKCKALKDFEKQILGSKSLYEASEKINKVKSRGSKDTMSMKESVTPGEYIKYKF